MDTSPRPTRPSPPNLDGRALLADPAAHASARCPIAQHAAHRPDAPALVLPEQPAVTFAALETHVRTLSAWLSGAGIRAGDRVAFVAEPTARGVALFWAMWRLGACAVPLAPNLPGAGLAERVALAHVHHVLHRPQGADAPGTAADWAGTARVHTLPTLDGPTLDGPTLSQNAPARATPPDVPVLVLQGPATVIFSSGSTGTPKAIVHSLSAHVCSALGSTANLAIGPGDTWALTLGAFHVGGLAILVRALLAGAAVGLPGEPARPRTDATHATHAAPAWARALWDTRATHASLVTAQLAQVLDRATHGGPPAALRHVLVGGGPIAADLVRAAAGLGLDVRTTYGCTELASQVCTTSARSADSGALNTPDALDTAGRPLPGRVVTLKPAPHDAPGEGEICLGGATLALGRLDGRGQLVPLTAADGLYHTGDVGRWDSAGRLVVRGRRDAMFITGGENVHPAELERHLCSVPGILDAVVVPVPDPTWGMRPVAYVVYASGVDGGRADDARDEAERGEAVQAAMRDRVPGFAVPDRVSAMPAAAYRGGLKPSRAWLAAHAAGSVP